MHIRTTAFVAVIVGCSILALFSSATFSQTNTLTVGAGGQFSSIQKAVDSASAGDTIVVYSGTYRENVNVNKQLIMVGEDTGTGKPIVDAGGDGSAILLSANGVSIFGFALTGSSAGGAGIKVLSNNDLIKDCDLYDNYDGIFLHRSSNDIITSNNAHDNSYDGINLNQSCDNSIINNKISSNDHDGIRIEQYSHHNLIEGNSVTDNALSSVERESRNAMTIYMSDGNVVQGNTMKNNGGTVVRDSGIYRLGDGVMAMDTRDTVVRNNTMNDNHYAVWVYHSTNATVTGNVATKHYYCIVVEDSSDVLVSDNVLSKGGRDARIISSTSVTFRNNTMYDAVFDMSIDGSQYCTLDGNALYNSEYDTLLISNSNNNKITNNSITAGSSGYCLNIDSSNNNDLYLNDLLSSMGAVTTSGSINRWESPSVIPYGYGGSTFTGYLGNYWGGGVSQDADGNGIADNKIIIDSRNIDHYPLMGPYTNYIPPRPVKVTVTPTAVSVRPSPSPEGWDPWEFLVHLLDFLRGL